MGRRLGPGLRLRPPRGLDVRIGRLRQPALEVDRQRCTALLRVQREEWEREDGPAGGAKRAVARARRKVVSAVDGGEWDALIDAPMHTGLEAAADAVERLLSGASIGKVVLRVG